MTRTIRSMRRVTPPTSPVFIRCLSTAIVALLTVSDVSGQYDWTRHLGTQQTGFEKHWFGTWDLEVRTMRGMVDWNYYSGTKASSWGGLKKIVRRATRIDRADSSRHLVHHSETLFDPNGRPSVTVFLDPITGRPIQRELLKFDGMGRLLEWRPVKDPADVAFAPVTRTLFEDVLPVGRTQSFTYFPDGRLQRWNACLSDGRRNQRCDEAYAVFDSTEKVIEFAWLDARYRLKRNDQGNVEQIEIVDNRGRDTTTIVVQHDDLLVREKYVDVRFDGMERIASKTSGGRLAQYRIPSAPGSLQYSTTAWEYDAENRLTAIRKGLQEFRFGYDSAGHVVSAGESASGLTVTRTFDSSGRLSSQSPPRFYNRFDLVEQGIERFVYDSDGRLAAVNVFDQTGAKVAELTFEYESVTDRGNAAFVRSGQNTP